MTLSDKVQTLVDQMVQELGMQSMRPSGLRIAFDDQGIVQCVTPEVTFRKQKVLDRRTEPRA